MRTALALWAMKSLRETCSVHRDAEIDECFVSCRTLGVQRGGGTRVVPYWLVPVTIFWERWRDCVKFNSTCAGNMTDYNVSITY